MKINYLLYFILGIFLFTSCEDYLEKTPEAEVTEQEIFNNYQSFQGFQDYNYAELPMQLKTYLAYTLMWGGEAAMQLSWGGERQMDDGNYWAQLGPSPTSHLYQDDATRSYGDKTTWGVWVGGWRAIRNSNVCLEKLPLLTNATQEERDLIEGQARFFRAYFHGLIMEFFGGMPYIDTVYAPAAEMREPRLTYQECTERIIEDIDKAIPLLPEDWDETVVGAQRQGANTGRITKGVALAFKQKFLLYAGSPLMNGFSGGNFDYNKAYCERAAAAGWEMIKLANTGRYSLVPMENYNDNFHNSNTGKVVWTSETIWCRLWYRRGTSYDYNHLRRNFIPSYLGGLNNWPKYANQLIVDRFEMADGTRYKVEYDQDDDKRWKNRDTRFYKNFFVDRDKVGDHANAVARLYVGPESNARPTNHAETPYMIKKYWHWGANGLDKRHNILRIATPLMRLAEVYLDYAEAVTVAYGPNGSAPGSSLTAVDAVNIIRQRAGMPLVTSSAEGYESWMDLLRNERIVELIFEAPHYWMDIRRWYVAHLPEYKPVVTLDFDKDWTYFNRRVHHTRVFENPKHYWMPIYKDQVQLYPEFYQNPGW